MRKFATYFAIATLALGAPAAFAQSANTNMNTTKTAPAASMPKAPSAGDANTGSSGGGATGNETTGSTTKNSNCMDVRANPAKYSKDIVANCK